MKVHGPVVDANADLQRAQAGEHLVAPDGRSRVVDLTREEVPGVARPLRRTRRQVEGEIFQQLFVARPERLATPPAFLDALELVDADRCGELGQVVLEAGLEDLVVREPVVARAAPGIRAHAVQREPPQPVGEPRVARDQQSAVRGRDALRDVEAEAAEVAERTAVPPIDGRLERVRRVFDEREPVLARE